MKNSFLFNTGMLLKRDGIRFLLHTSFYSAIGEKRPIILFGSGYNWDDALLELYQAGFHPIIRSLNTDINAIQSDGEKKNKDFLLNIFKECDQLNKICLMYGIDTRPLLFEKLSVILAKSIIISYPAYQHFSNLIQENKPNCVLISTQVHPVDQIFIQVAHDNNIPVISWQHGGGGYCYHPLMAFAEFIESDVHLVFGPAVKKSYINTSQKMEIGISPKIIEVGSSSLDSERKTLTMDSTTSSDNGPIIYITERFLNNFYYISTSYDATSINDTFWCAQKKFLQVAKQKSSLHFIFKLHPSDLLGEPIRSYIKDNQINNVRLVVRESSVNALVRIARIIVIDFIATTVLEALLTNKPVFIYSGLYNIDEYPLKLLKKRAFVYENLDDLIRGVEEFLGTDQSDFLRKRDVDYYNSEFLEEFGTFKDDGNSAIRAVDVVKEIVRLNSVPAISKFMEGE